MFKRIISVLLAAVLVLSLCGCTKEIENSGNNDFSEPVISSSPDDPTSDDPVEEDNSTPAVDPYADWSYNFGHEFIDENGIGYIWERLDEKTKKNLGEALNAIRNVEMFCPLSVGFMRDEAQSFLELLSNCTIFYSYISSSYKMHFDGDKVIALTFKYVGIDYEEDGYERNRVLEEKLGSVVAGMPKGQEHEKLKYLHDWLVLNCEYGENAASPFSAYGAIVEGNATCQGYADAMHLLMSRAGFETMFATGEGKNTSVKHKWCYVKLSDGHWYVVDPTWDDPENKSEREYIGYDYFLISDEMLLRDHAKKYESTFYDVPVADSMDLSFYKTVGWVATTAEEAQSILEKQAVEMAKEGRRYLYLRVEDPEQLEDIYSYVASGRLGENKLEAIIKNANKEAGTNYDSSRWSKILNKALGTVTITLGYTE